VISIQIRQTRSFARVDLPLRYSGLRIRDAVTLSRNLSRTINFPLNGEDSHCGFIARFRLCCGALTRFRERLFFWSGLSKPKSAVGDCSRSLKRLLHLGWCARWHAHRFRDTFSVELLLPGVPIERVRFSWAIQVYVSPRSSMHRGFGSVQEQLEADVGALGRLTNRTRGTRRVHGKRRTLIQFKIKNKDMVEAGGVEPPVRKRYDTKPTCLAHSLVPPATLRMSKNASRLVR